MHLCNVCCSRHLRAPAPVRGPGLKLAPRLMWLLRVWQRSGPDVLLNWDRCFISTSWAPPQKDCCMFPQVPHLPRETLDWACHTLLLTGCWDQNLGAYLFLVSSSHCCVLTPMLRLHLLQKALLPHIPAPRWKGNERTFLAAGGAREMTGRAEANDISIKQTCLTLRTWAPGEIQPGQTAQFCAHITFGEEMGVSPGTLH